MGSHVIFVILYNVDLFCKGYKFCVHGNGIERKNSAEANPCKSITNII